jgi:N-carbamoylputrescine amidase
MKISYMQAAEGLVPNSADWTELKNQITQEQPDLLVTNEMPFGNWLAASRDYSVGQAEASIAAHDSGIEALKALNLPLIVSSQPVPYKDKLANEAFVLDNGEYKYAHQKHFFPEESGYFETAWFKTEKPGFDLIQTDQLNIGVLLCTELMFNERAREYGRQGAHLIVIPRATEQGYAHWKTAASMAAIVSGCYVVSSNRVGQFDESLTFGGKGFAYAPDGSFISETSAQNPVVSFELDFEFVKTQQQQYPCYVKETIVS